MDTYLVIIYVNAQNIVKDGNEISSFGLLLL